MWRSGLFAFVFVVLTTAKVNVMSMNAFLDQLSSSPPSYLYDVPIAKRLSALFEHWKVPSYFCAFDFLRKTRLPHPFSNWPTLFVGAKVGKTVVFFFFFEGFDYKGISIDNAC